MVSYVMFLYIKFNIFVLLKSKQPIDYIRSKKQSIFTMLFIQLNSLKKKT